MQFGAFNGGLGRQIGHTFKRSDKLWPTIRIAGIVNGIDPNENIPATQHFGPGQRQ